MVDKTTLINLECVFLNMLPFVNSLNSWVPFY